MESIWSAKQGLIRVCEMVQKKLDHSIINANEQMLQGVSESRGMKFVEMELKEQLGQLQYTEGPTSAWIPMYAAGKLIFVCLFLILEIPNLILHYIMILLGTRYVFKP